MLARADDDEEIARRSAVGAGISFSRDADTLAVAGAWLHAHFERLGTFHHAFTVARRADVLCFARSSASRARHVEVHAPTRLRNRSLAAAFRTRARSAHHASPTTVCASIEPRDVQAQYCSSDRVPEADVDLVFEIAAVLRPTTRAWSGAAASTEDA